MSHAPFQNARGRLTAKRDLLIESVRAWYNALNGPLGQAFLESSDLEMAWVDYLGAEKKAGIGDPR